MSYFQSFFFFPEQTNSPELCSVPEHPGFYFIVLEDEKLFHSTPTKSVIPSTTQSHRALSPTQCLWLSLSSSASCLSILQAWNLYTSSLLNASLTLTYPESTHIFLYPSHRAGELSLHQGTYGRQKMRSSLIPCELEVVRYWGVGGIEAAH